MVRDSCCGHLGVKLWHEFCVCLSPLDALFMVCSAHVDLTSHASGGRCESTSWTAHELSTLNTQVREKFPLNMPGVLVLSETLSFNSLIVPISVCRGSTLCSDVIGARARHSRTLVAGHSPDRVLAQRARQPAGVFRERDALRVVAVRQLHLATMFEPRLPAFGPCLRSWKPQQGYLEDETPFE